MGGVMGLILGLNLFEISLSIIRSAKKSFAAFNMRVRHVVFIREGACVWPGKWRIEGLLSGDNL